MLLNESEIGKNCKSVNIVKFCNTKKVNSSVHCLE